MTTTTTLQLFAGELTAADVPRRTISGRVVTYGEYGSTSLGRKRIRAGALELPEDSRRVLILRGHSPEGTPSGVAVQLQDSITHLDASFRISATPDGDVLLAEADPACPVRAGLSVELVDVELDPADPSTVIRGRLKAVAAVPFPAYPSSRMTTVAASEHTPGDDSVTAPVQPPPAPAPAPAPAPVPAPVPAPAPAPVPAPAPAPQELQGQHTPAPASLPAGLNGVPGAQPATTGLTLDRLVELHAAYGRGERSAELHAALQDVTYSAHPATRTPEYAGELWSGPGYVRRFVPLVTQLKLKSYKGTGWRWVTKPEVADYPGDKAAVPSNPVVTEPADWTAERVAGAWDIDRAYVDFGDAEFFRSFYRATTDSYKQKTDAKVLAFLVANATDAITLAGQFAYVEPGADVLDGAAILSALMGDIPTVAASADFVLMNTATFLGLRNVTNFDVSAFLKLLGVNPEKFRYSNQVAAGRIVAGTSTAVEYRELGDVPIRVEAVDVSRGGVDSGVFGYCSNFLARENGLLSLPISAPVGFAVDDADELRAQLRDAEAELADLRSAKKDTGSK